MMKETLKQMDLTDSSASLDESSDRNESVSKSRRTMLKASWVPPVILAVSLPRSGYAQNVSDDSKGKGKGK